MKRVEDFERCVIFSCYYLLILLIRRFLFCFVNPFPPAEKKKFGEKIKKMALPRPPSNAADRNFWRNHTSPGHKNWDAILQERVL
jgi:hypothetical protein